MQKRRRHRKNSVQNLFRVMSVGVSSEAENLSAQGVEYCKAIDVSVCVGMFKILNLAFFQVG